MYGILANLFIHCNNTDMTRSWVDQLPTKTVEGTSGRAPQAGAFMWKDDTIAIFTEPDELEFGNRRSVYPYSIGGSKANVTSTREQVNSFKFDRMYCGPSIDISNNGLNVLSVAKVGAQSLEM